MVHSEDLSKTTNSPNKNESAMAGITDYSANSMQQEFWGTIENKDVSIDPKSSLECSSPTPFSPYYCKVCKIEMTGPEPYNQHLNGSSHAKQEKRLKMQHHMLLNGSICEENSLQRSTTDSVLPPANSPLSISNYHCDVCNVTMSGYEPYQQHMKGMQHLKRKRRLDQEKMLLNSPAVPPVGENVVQRNENVQPANQAIVPQYYCLLCNIAMSGVEPYNQHIQGGPHQRRVKNQEQLAMHVQTQQMTTVQSNQLQTNVQNSYQPANVQSYQPPTNVQNYQPSTNVQNFQQQLPVTNMPPNFYCELCKKAMSGYEPYVAHMNGSQHAKELNRQRLLGKSSTGVQQSIETTGFVQTPEIPLECQLRMKCDACVKSFSGIESLQAHFRSLKHIKKVEQQKMMMNLQSISFPSANGVNSVTNTMSTLQLDCNSSTESSSGDQHIPACGDNQKVGENQKVSDFLKTHV